MRTAGRDQDMVDRVGQAVEEPLQGCRVVGVEGGGAPRVDFERRSLEALGIPAGEDDVGALTARAAGGLEADSGAPADEYDGLAEQSRLTGTGLVVSVFMVPPVVADGTVPLYESGRAR